MSHYARNHLQDDWAQQTRAEIEQHVQAAETEAAWYFDRATKREKAEFDATMRAMLGVTGPRADRARDQARARWRNVTAEAHTLPETTIECMLASGEVSAELDERWTALFNRAATARQAAE